MTEIPVSSKVTQQIIEKTNSSTGMFVQQVYKETLANLIKQFSNVYYINKNNDSIKIKCIHGNQERAIARISTGDNITLPLISISESGTSNDNDRNRNGINLMHTKYWDSVKHRAIRILSLMPRAINIAYEINIWTKYKQDMDQIREYIYFLFNPALQITTSKNDLTKAFLDEESDSSQISVKDQEDRVLQKKITITVETYIQSPKFLYTSTGKIEELAYDVEILGNTVPDMGNDSLVLLTDMRKLNNPENLF